MFARNRLWFCSAIEWPFIKRVFTRKKCNLHVLKCLEIVLHQTWNLGTLGERYFGYLKRRKYVFIRNATRKSVYCCKIFLLDMDKLFFQQHGNKLSNNKREWQMTLQNYLMGESIVCYILSLLRRHYNVVCTFH